MILMKNILFKEAEPKENIVAQLKSHRLFAPLTEYFQDADAVQLSQKLRPRELTVAELKKILNYNAEQDLALVSRQEVETLAGILENSENITLPLPVVIKLNKKNLKKLFRIDKYYNNSTYLFYKFTGEKLLKNTDFYLPFLQTVALLAMLKVLPEKQKITIVIMDNLDELINIKAMLAINKKIKEQPAIQPTSATLIMSEECNLRCVYCYEPHKARDKTTLTFETAKQVLRKFDRDAKICFFGGEPMLHIDLMKKICEWGWEYRNFTFDMITNGQIIDREFFRNYAKYFKYVQLSCDGPIAPNDINRGHGSFKRAMEFYKAFQEETGWAPTIHAVMSKYSMPYLLDVIKWFHEMEKDSPDPNPFRWLPGDASSWNEEDFTVYAEQLAEIKKWYLENNICNSKWQIKAFAQAEQELLGLNNKMPVPLRNDATFCSAGRSLLAILPNGNIVPCHHEYWCAEEERLYEEIGINEDSPGINHMSELCMKDIPECNSCPQWGCCVCPGSFYFHSKSYTTPDKNWCRAGKLLIETARSYAEELAQKLHDEQHKVDYLAAGVDYLLQKETNSKIDLSKPR
jgi:uncharacterized protein